MAEGYLEELSQQLRVERASAASIGTIDDDEHNNSHAERTGSGSSHSGVGVGVDGGSSVIGGLINGGGDGVAEHVVGVEAVSALGLSGSKSGGSIGPTSVGSIYFATADDAVLPDEMDEVCDRARGEERDVLKFSTNGVHGDVGAHGRRLDYRGGRGGPRMASMVSQLSNNSDAATTVTAPAPQWRRSVGMLRLHRSPTGVGDSIVVAVAY